MGDIVITPASNDVNSTAGTLVIRTSDSQAMSLKTNDANRLYITPAGYFGVGTTGPNYPFDLNLGTISTNTNAFGYNVSGDATSNVGYCGYNFQLNNSTANASAYIRLARTSATAYLGLEIASQSRDGIRFLTNAASPVEVARITAAGNVGIGTNNPSAKLEVAGSLRVTGVGQIGPAGGYGIALFNDQTNNFIGQLYGRANGIQFTDILGNATVYIASGGNVGIGEQSPVAKLQVTSNLEAAVFKGTATFGSAIQIEASSAGGRLYQIQSTANGAGEGGGRLLLVDKTAAATRLTIKSDGNVGIGTTNPTKKLQVAGSLYWDYNGTAAEEHTVGIQRTVAAANGAFTEIGTLAASASSIRATFEIFHHDSGTIEYSLFELIANYYTGTTTDWVQLPSRTQAHYAGDRNGVVVDARLSTTGGSVELRLRSIGGAAGAMLVNVRIKSNTNLTETSATGTGATVAGLLGFNRYEFPVTDNRFKATTEGLFILNNGNIGIGTTNPIGKLTVQGNIEVNYNSTTADTFVRRSFLTPHATINRGANIVFGLLDGGSGPVGMTVYNVAAAAGAFNSQFITFNTHEGGVNEGERMRITQLGNVGIGTFTPLSLLAVGEAGSTTAAKGLTFGGDAQANLYRAAEDTIKTDGSLNVAGLIYNGNSAYYASVAKSTTANWGQYTVVLGNASYSSQLVQVTVNGGNLVWAGTFLASCHLSYRPNETWINVKLLECATYNCSNDDVNLLALSNSTTSQYGTPSLVLKTNGAINAGFGTGYANNITVTVNGPSPNEFVLSSSSWTQPYTYQIATSANTKQIYTTESGNVGIGITNPSSQANYKFLQVNGTNSAVIETMVGGARIGGFDSTASALYVGTIGNFPVIFRTQVDEKMRIAANGNVGIGTTSPNAKLESYFSSNALTFNYLATNINVNSPIPIYAFGVTSPAETVSIKAGIGYERHLPNGRGTLHIYNRATDDTSNIGGTRSSAGDIKVSIANDGNVGISSTVPGARLDVVGAARISANILSHKTASYTTSYPGISSFGADATDSGITYYDTGKLVANTQFRGIVWTGKHYIFTDQANNRAYFYDNNFVQITNAYGYYFVTLPLPSGYGSPHGAAWDGRYLWCVVYTGSASKIVGYDLDTTTQTATIIAESAALPINATYDVEYADGHLYLVFSGTLYIYKWNGSSIDAVSNYPGAAGTINAQAITYDGSYLWATQNGVFIYKIGLDGTPLATITTFPPNITGWAWNGSNIVCFDFNNRNIFIINTTRLRIDTQNLALMGGNVGIGITNAGSKLQVYASAAVNNSKLFMAGDNANNLSYVPSTTAGGWNGASVLGGSALFNSLGSTWLVGTHNGPAMRIGTNNISFTNPIGGIDLYVGSGANIGISNTTPKFALHVNGDVTIPNARYLNFNPGELQGTAINRAIVASYSDDTATAQPKQLGIILHNDSNTNDTFSPALVFGSKSNSSNYSQATAVIAGRRRSLVGDANWHAGELWFWTATSNDAGGIGVGIPTATPAMVINSTRFVGIGASSPGDKLQVNLNSGENILANIIGNGVSANNKVGFKLSELGVALGEFSAVRDGTSYQVKLQTLNNQPLSFGTSGTTRMVIDGSFVGIGSTTPTALLNVRASIPAGIGTTPAGTNVLLDSNASNYITFRNSADNGTYAGLVFLDNNVGGYVAFGNAGAAVGSDSMIYGAYQDHIFQNNYVNENLYNRPETMRIKQNGRVGIGTNTPTTLLSVGGLGSTTAASGITFGGDAEVNLYRIGENILKTDGNFQIVGSLELRDILYHYSNIRFLNKAGSNWLTWFTRDTSESEAVARLDYIRSINTTTAGNLGIGTTLPSGKLHVVSSVSNDTVLRADGTNGTLFSVVDDLSDSLMSVNNSAGLPVLEVFADDRIVMGQYGVNDFVLTNNKIGLGTNNPQFELDIVGAGTNAAVNVITRMRSTAGSDVFNTASVLAFTNTTTNSSAYSYIGGRIDLGGAGDNAQSLVFATNTTNTLPTEKMRIKSDGTVGIGTTNPSWLLTTYAAVAPQFALSNATRSFILTNNAGDNLLSFNYNSANRLQFDTANQWFNIGNLGVGTTAAAQKLDVRGFVVSDANSNAVAGGFFVGGSSHGMRREAGSNDVRLHTNGGDLIFGAAGSGSQQVTLKNGGNFGINITSPTSRLHVVETTPTGSRIQLGSISTSALMNANLVNDFLILTAPFNAVPASTSNNNAKWGIKMGGGSVDAPNALEKSACIYAVSEEDIGAGGAGAGYNRKVGLALHTSPFDLPNVERVRINNLGDVGIGLTNPAYRLQVSGGDVSIASANILRFGTVAVLNTASSANDIYANIRVLRNESTVNTDGMFINYNSNGTTAAHLRFYANGATERMRIDASNGYVGVGTTVPDVKFDVYDDLNGGNISAVRNANTGSNAFAALVFRRNSNLNGLVMFTNSSNRSSDGGLGNSTIRTDNGKLLLGAGASTYHSLETNGNVGIGLTNPAAARLHIKGDGTNPVLRVETADLQSAAGGTASKTFVGWMPIMTGAAVGDKVFIPLFK